MPGAGGAWSGETAGVDALGTPARSMAETGTTAAVHPHGWSPAVTRTPTRAVPTGTDRFRPDIEGLRAVAIVLVLLFHAALRLAPGGFVGVDVFFVLSGFLITTQLVSELRQRGTISLARFYGRRAKRLLPAAGLVLVATAVLVRVFLPPTRWEEAGGDIVASAVYLVNWRFALRSVDYLTESAAPSPIQHFWSLAVEEQYYLIWPVLILLAALVARRMGRRVPAVLWVGLAVVVLPSFMWSVSETAGNSVSAFFVTTTRMWELGIGAAVALGANWWARLPKPWAIGVGWTGLAAVATSGMGFSTGTPWPGYAAAVPTAGTAAVVVAGFVATRGGPASVLGLWPMRWLGGLSYPLYLWHWPLLVVATAHWGTLSVPRGLVIAGLTVVPAWLTSRWLENPLRHATSISRSPRLALSMGANFTLVGVVAGLALVLVVPTAGAEPTRHALGAAVLGAEPRNNPAGAPADDVGWMTPLPTRATADVPSLYRRGCQQSMDRSAVITCEYGQPQSPTTVAIVGDSKIAQWLPALELIAEQSGWRLVTYLKSSCGFTMATLPYHGKPFVSCTEWRDAVLARLTADPPEYVVTSQLSRLALEPRGAVSENEMVKGLRAIWARLTATGTTIVVVADNPPPPFEVYECAAKYPKKLSMCAFSRNSYAISAGPVQHRAVEGQRGVRIVDLNDAVCPTDLCAPVIGNVLIYRQDSHITATYVLTLTPRLTEALSRAGMKARYAGG